jgi:glucose/arabinose dehydrogenase
MHHAPGQVQSARLLFHRSATIAVATCLLSCVTGCDVINQLGSLLGLIPTPTGVSLQLVSQGLIAPVAMVVPPDGSGRLFILDQPGQIRIIDADSKLLPAPFLDIADRLVPVGIDFGGGFVFDERGLLGLAFHPQYADNGRFFVFYTAPKQADIPADFDSETHISEFRVMPGDSNVADPTSERILLRYGKPQFNHNGGQLAFGPDGFLYIAVGDGGAANDDGIGHNPETGNAQDKTTLLGKILRIDVNNGDPYGIPPDNPLLSDPAARPELFAWGFRNPWKFSFEPGGAGRLFVADVGQDLFEEVDIVTRGGNYGWRIREGSACFDKDNPTAPPPDCAMTAADGAPLIGPISAYPHIDPAGGPQGIAAIGGFIYHGSKIPGLTRHYFFGDFSRDFGLPDGSIFAARENIDGSWTLTELTVAGRPGGRLGQYLLAIGEDADGELYLLTSDNVGPFGAAGQVHRVISAP